MERTTHRRQGRAVTPATAATGHLSFYSRLTAPYLKKNVNQAWINKYFVGLSCLLLLGFEFCQKQQVTVLSECQPGRGFIFLSTLSRFSSSQRDARWRPLQSKLSLGSKRTRRVYQPWRGTPLNRLLEGLDSRCWGLESSSMQV